MGAVSPSNRDLEPGRHSIQVHSTLPYIFLQSPAHLFFLTRRSRKPQKQTTWVLILLIARPSLCSSLAEHPVLADTVLRHGLFEEERWRCRGEKGGSVPCRPQGARRRQPVRQSQAPPAVLFTELVEKQPDLAIVWFWKAINSGDRVDSALKDMAVVMKQQDRSQEAIEAIRSFRHLCSKQAQESLDNLLIDLYKKCGKVDEQIELLKQKLKMIYLGEAFNGKATKKARSHGKKFQVSIQQETSRILGNLGWAYMQQNNYEAAELVYRKAQTIEPDSNRACNLAMCLIKQGRHEEARQVLEDVLQRRIYGSDDEKVVARAEQLLCELNPLMHVSSPFDIGLTVSEELMERLDLAMNEWTPFRSRRLPVFEEIATFRDQMAC
ncbi:hypothetical protein EJB05_35283, partial [Eragrostis curvula]